MIGLSRGRLHTEHTGTQNNSIPHGMAFYMAFISKLASSPLICEKLRVWGIVLLRK